MLYAELSVWFGKGGHTDSSWNLELLMFWNDHSHHIHKTLGMIPCFSLNWDKSQLQQLQDFGTDPNALFFIELGSQLQQSQDFGTDLIGMVLLDVV